MYEWPQQIFVIVLFPIIVTILFFFCTQNKSFRLLQNICVYLEDLRQTQDLREGTIIKYPELISEQEFET